MKPMPYLRALSVLVALVALTSCSKDDSPTSPSNSFSSIEYRVTGSATRVSLTYQTAGGVSQVASAALPWTFSRTAVSGDFLYVSAQIIEGSGTATATILRNGSEFRSTTSSGFASIATVSGTAP